MVVPFYCGDNTGVYANAGFAIAVFANVVFAIAGGHCVLYNIVVNYISLATVNPSNPRSER